MKPIFQETALTVKLDTHGVVIKKLVCVLLKIVINAMITMAVIVNNANQDIL